MSVGVSKEFILNSIGDDLTVMLGKLGGFSHLEVLHDNKTIADATTKMFVFNENNERVAFLLCNFSEAGDIGRRNLLNNQQFKDGLNKKNGSVLLDPMLSGEVEGVEYSVWPYCTPLGEGLGLIRRKIQLFQIRPLVLEWLINANKDSLLLASQSEVTNDFIIPLKQLSKRVGITPRVKDEINWQIQCLQDKSWKPYFVLAHNDLWKGNILINKNKVDNSYGGVSVIDWAGGFYRSFAVYDLVRVSMSLKVSRSTFQQELEKHCTILLCNKKNLLGYLLASFAFLANNLGEFPEVRFIELLHNCFDYLDDKI